MTTGCPVPNPLVVLTLLADGFAMVVSVVLLVEGVVGGCFCVVGEV